MNETKENAADRINKLLDELYEEIEKTRELVKENREIDSSKINDKIESLIDQI